MNPIEAFFLDLDSVWLGTPTRVPLRILGSSALMLQTSYYRGTKDADILETTEINPLIQGQLLSLAGKSSPLFHRHRLYIEFLAPAFPLLAPTAFWSPLESLNQNLTHFELWVLDPTDIAVSKLRRFHGNDRADIDEMIHRGLIPHAQFVSQFRQVLESLRLDARSADIPRLIANFNTVERDFFLEAETVIEIPEWADC